MDNQCTSKDEQYISDLAKSFIFFLQITVGDLGKYRVARNLYQKYNERIKEELCTMEQWEWGRIALLGGGTGERRENESRGTSLYQVHCGPYLDEYGSGEELILKIACTTIVAKMTDILLQKTHKKLSEATMGSIPAQALSQG